MHLWTPSGRDRRGKRGRKREGPETGAETASGLDVELKMQQAAGIVARRLGMGIEVGLSHVTSRAWQRRVVPLGVEMRSEQSGVLAESAILDHAESPYHRGRTPNASCVHTERNAACGDWVRPASASANALSVMPASRSADSGRENNSSHLRSDSISRNCPFACPPFTCLRLLGPKFLAHRRWTHGKRRWASEFWARESLLGRNHASGCRQTVVRRRRRSVRSGGLVDSPPSQVLSCCSVAPVLLTVVESR